MHNFLNNFVICNKEIGDKYYVRVTVMTNFTLKYTVCN